MKKLVIALLLVVAAFGLYVSRDDMALVDEASSAARDPGPRSGAAGAGAPLTGLTDTELALFNKGKDEFEQEEDVADGLGPTMNLGSCAGCHAQPAVGGTSANKNGNDGTVARFGWKAQNKSLLLFSGEAYNVEMGITNELFQTERDETPGCQFATVPNDVTKTDGTTPLDALGAIEKFAAFAR